MPIHFPLISVNGDINASISPLDRGFAYGDGVFETCRFSRGSIPLWNSHFERLRHSAKRLHIPFDEDLLETYLQEILALLVKENIELATVKIMLTRGVGGRGYRLPDQVLPTYCIGVFPGESLQSNAYLNGVSVRTCDLRLSQVPALAGMKHLNRLEHILARAEWQNEFAEGLLLDVENRVVEATVSNVFVVKNKKLFTPDLSRAGVAGIMRKTILENLAPILGIESCVTDINLAFLESADEIFLSNSVYGIWPVNSLDCGQHCSTERQYSYSCHQITRALQQQLQLLLGE